MGAISRAAAMLDTGAIRALDIEVEKIPYQYSTSLLEHEFKSSRSGFPSFAYQAFIICTHHLVLNHSLRSVSPCQIPPQSQCQESYHEHKSGAHSHPWHVIWSLAFRKESHAQQGTTLSYYLYDSHARTFAGGRSLVVESPCDDQCDRTKEAHGCSIDPNISDGQGAGLSDILVQCTCQCYGGIASGAQDGYSSDKPCSGIGNFVAPVSDQKEEAEST